MPRQPVSDTPLPPPSYILHKQGVPPDIIPSQSWSSHGFLPWNWLRHQLIQLSARYNNWIYSWQLCFSPCTTVRGVLQGKLPLRESIFRICKKRYNCVTSVGLLLQGYVDAIPTVLKVWLIQLGVSWTSSGSICCTLSRVNIESKIWF